MSQPSLESLFREERASLEATTGGRADPARTLRALRDVLDHLPDEYTVGSGDHTRGDAVVRDLVEAIRAVVGAITVVRQPVSREAPARRGLLDFLNAGNPATRRSGPPRDPQRTTPRATSPARLEADTGRLLDEVTAGLEAIDRALAKLPRTPNRGDRTDTWVADGDLLDLAQDLLAARMHANSEEAMLRIEQLEEQLLLRHDIRAVTYAGTQDTQELWFDFVPSRDPGHQTFTTRRPALAVGDRLLRRGEVRMPREGGPS